MPRVSCVRQEAEKREVKPPEKRGCPGTRCVFQHYPVVLYEQNNVRNKKEKIKE